MMTNYGQAMAHYRHLRRNSKEIGLDKKARPNNWGVAIPASLILRTGLNAAIPHGITTW